MKKLLLITLLLICGCKKETPLDGIVYGATKVNINRSRITPTELVQNGVVCKEPLIVMSQSSDQNYLPLHFYWCDDSNVPALHWEILENDLVIVNQ
jgi:hypothetical protein